MRTNIVIISMFLFLPVNVFAHAGHVEWSLFALSSWSELVEASLVVSAFTIYLLASRQRNLKSPCVKTKRHK